MIDFKGKNSQLLTGFIKLHGFKVAHTGDALHGFDLRGNTNSMIDALVQQVIDSFDEVAADKEKRTEEIDEIAARRAWRPIASDIMRVIDARKFVSDGEPATPAAGEYLWLIDSATAKLKTLPQMASIILNKENQARLKEKQRLDDKAAILAEQ